jgi:hypothetical protein
LLKLILLEFITIIIICVIGYFAYQHFFGKGVTGQNRGSPSWMKRYRTQTGKYFGLTEEESANRETFSGSASFNDTPLSVGLRLPKGELVLEHFPHMIFYKYKSDGRVSGAGITARVKVVKGVYLRAGQGKVGISKSWQPDASGDLYITNKGIIFDGDLKNIKLTWDKILRENYREDSITFEKSTGDPLVFGDYIEPEKAARTHMIGQMYESITKEIADGNYPTIT